MVRIEFSLLFNLTVEVLINLIKVLTSNLTLDVKVYKQVGIKFSRGRSTMKSFFQPISVGIRQKFGILLLLC